MIFLIFIIFCFVVYKSFYVIQITKNIKIEENDLDYVLKDFNYYTFMRNINQINDIYLVQEKTTPKKSRIIMIEHENKKEKTEYQRKEDNTEQSSSKSVYDQLNDAGYFSIY